MELTQNLIDDVLVLHLHDERLDTKIAPDLKAEFITAIGEQHIRLLLNLEDVKYADSSGLGALLLGMRQTREYEGDFRICCANSRIMHLITIARLDNHLINFDSEQEALKSFARQPEPDQKS